MHVMKKGILYAVLASVLWAIVNPFIKQGLSYDFSPMNFAGLRFTVVGIILFAYTWHRGMWREIMQHRRLFGNLILINMFMGYTAFYFGVDFVSGAISSIVMGLTPLINVLLAHLVASNDRLNRYKVVSLAVSLAGLLLIVGTAATVRRSTGAASGVSSCCWPASCFRAIPRFRFRRTRARSIRSS